MPSVHAIKHEAKKLLSVKSLSDCSKLLQTEQHKLVLLSQKPIYKVYEIPKKNGLYRLIEDPEANLKKVLRKLNDFLQAVYFTKRPDCVHGFCISADKEPNRTILSNAQKHIGKPYMLNIDLKDFFHTITIQLIDEIFSKQFPRFQSDLIDTLINLCSYYNRLPMGSPTSPVLSNFASLEMDTLLMQYVNYSGITYTRFADDLSFSSAKPITKIDVEEIRNTILKQHFIINENKVKSYSPADEKTVTGLIITEKEVTLPTNYIDKLKQEIERMFSIMLDVVNDFKEYQFVIAGTTNLPKEAYQMAIDMGLKVVAYVNEDFEETWRYFLSYLNLLADICYGRNYEAKRLLMSENGLGSSAVT